MTVNGKLDRRALPAPEYQDADGYRAPASAVEEILAGIYAQVLGLERVGVDDSFFDLGGDSLSAMRAIAAINTALDAQLAVRTLFEAPSVSSLSQQLGSDASTVAVPAATGPSFAFVHGRDTTEVHASDLTLDKFIDATTLTAAPTLPGPSAEVRTVLLTGATGFLGRYLVLQWLEQMERVDGTLICLVRAKSDDDARHRLEKAFDSGDPELLSHFRELAADRLEVIAGDKGEADLGLDQQTWQRLADTVDLIVDSAAFVNSVLPYSELFGPNVVGTAELIRFALTTKLKPYTFVSTADVEPPDRALGVHRGCRHPGHQPHPYHRRQLRQRLRQQQVGRRGAAARGPRPIRPAGRGVPLRHDHGRPHICGPAQRVGRGHSDGASA